MTSTLSTFLSKALIYQIYNITGLCKKMLSITPNIFDLDSIFSIDNTYTIQVFNLFIDCLFIQI